MVNNGLCILYEVNGIKRIEYNSFKNNNIDLNLGELNEFSSLEFADLKNCNVKDIVIEDLSNISLVKTYTKLPYGLQEIEYLYSDGTAYLHFNLIETNTKIICQFNVTNKPTNNRNDIIFAKSLNGYGYCGVLISPSLEVIAGFGKRAYYTNYYIRLNTIYEAIIGNTGLIINNNLIDNNIRTEQGIYRLWGASNLMWGYPSFKGKIYSFKIEKNNIFINNLIPCYTTTSSWINELGNSVPIGTKGMYDLVNGVLYTNRMNNSDFIAGPEV